MKPINTTKGKAKSNSLGQQQGSDSQSDYKQRQALFIPNLDDNNIDPDELQAFHYILSVRNEANTIKQKRKQSRKKFKMMQMTMKEEIIVESEQVKEIQRNTQSIQVRAQQEQMESNQQYIGQSESEMQNQSYDSEQDIEVVPDKVQMNQQLAETLPDWFKKWKVQVIQNWVCIVENVKYLHKNPVQSLPFPLAKSISSQLLSQKPKIHSLASLTLSKIESMLLSLSQQYYHNNGGRYYYLWIYSLLAVHRSIAPYEIFESLATVNACITGENKITVECIVLAIILESQFSQKNLAKQYESMIGKIEEIG